MRRKATRHQRRLVCLLILSIWGFMLLMYLWKQLTLALQESKGEERNSKAFMKLQWNVKLTEHFERFNGDSIEGYNKSNIINNNINGTTEFISTSRTRLKIRSTLSSRIDYGRDRDVDVEGVNDYIMWHENFRKKHNLPVFPRQQKCTSPANNVAFLKTHYTGSNVITNILNRYGDLNNLNIALPSDGRSTFYWPMRFQWKYIDITLLNGSLPNIVANHARYNNDIMDNILYPGSKYVTILRDPATQLETSFNNLNFGSLLEIWNVTSQIEAFLNNPKFYIQRVIKGKRFKDTLNLIKNGQFFDLGLSTTDYHRKNVIRQAIQELYDKFSLVLIYEHLDESLVLMKRKFCWQLDDILYLSFQHTAENSWNDVNTTDKLKQRMRNWNTADMKLYHFFNKTLWTEIGYEGQNFWKDLKDFKDLRKSIEHECMTEDNDKIQHSKESRLSKSFMKAFQGNDLFGSGDDQIRKSVLKEPNFLQKLKMKTKKSAGHLLTDTTTEKPSFESSSGDESIENNYIKTQSFQINKQVSSWNEHFCKKLLLDEEQYLDYFRRKHAYAKSSVRHQQ